MTDGRDDVQDRVAGRFDTDDTDSQTVKNSQKARKAKKSEQELPNVKEEWKATSVYLPEHLDSDLTKAFKRLDLDLDDDLSQFQKTRHFYPLVIAAGIGRIESMESQDIIEELENIDPDLERYRE